MQTLNGTADEPEPKDEEVWREFREFSLRMQAAAQEVARVTTAYGTELNRVLQQMRGEQEQLLNHMRTAITSALTKMREQPHGPVEPPEE